MRGFQKSSHGFTLLEFLLSFALMALLSALLGVVLSNCRRTASASETSTERLRTEIILRDIIQSELDLSQTPLAFEYVGDRLAGFSVAAYGRFSGLNLKIRARYVFEPDPDRPAYRLMRYSIAETIGVRETKEVLLEGIRAPQIEGYSDAAAEYVPAEKLPNIPTLIRVKFEIIRNWPAMPDGAPEPAPSDDIQFILQNAWAEKPAA